MKETVGHISDLQRFSTHDGPGSRTAACYLGCLLPCAWRSNPESQQAALLPLFRQGWQYCLQGSGGVICGGAEPVVQPELLYNFLYALADQPGRHTCLAAAGFAPWPALEKTLPHFSLILFDFKLMNNAQRRRMTGAEHASVADNARRPGR